MSLDTTDEALVLVSLLKSKIVIATAVVMIKNAKSDGIPSAQYTSDFQKKYLSQNYEKISSDLKQNFLSHCHDDVLKTLRKAIPVSNKPARINQNSKTVSLNDGGDLDWIDELCMSEEEEEAEAAKKKRSRVQPSSTLKPKNTFGCENSAIENIKFVQSMMNLIEESEKDSPVSKNLLESLLYEESERVSDFNTDSVYSDSGIGTCSDQFTENSRCSVGLNSVSSGVVKSAIQSTKTKQLVLDSVRFVIDHLKQRIEKDVESVFQNWEGSEVQFMNRVLCKCSQVSVGCREALMSFIYSILDGIWQDKRLQQNRLWELKILIVNEFITDIEICKEVNQYIVDKVNYFIEHYTEKPKPPEFPAIADKLFFYVSLFSSVCDTQAELESDTTTHNSQKDILSENYISLFWQERLCPEEQNDDDFESSECEIQSLERLSIVASARHPLLAALAHEAIAKTRHLVNTRLSESQTTDFESSFSFT